MRVNVYREDLTSEAEIVWAESRSHPGIHYCGLRIYLKTPPAPPHGKLDADADRDAVTFWFESREEVEEFLTRLKVAVRPDEDEDERSAVTVKFETLEEAKKFLEGLKSLR